MPTFDCQVTWPTAPTQGDLIAPYLRPEHRCTEPADHVHVRYPDLDGFAVAPHVCHCGAMLEVRDVEPEPSK